MSDMALKMPDIYNVKKRMTDMDINRFLLFTIIGFAAQMIDGTLGMAYGVSSRTFLKSIAGLPSAMASAVVHAAEVPTTLVSGISHWRMDNVDHSKIFKLTIPGIIGGVIGSYFIMNVGSWVDPLISVYLIVMGLIIIRKAFRTVRTEKELGDKIIPLGFFGGFLDATGGGGWGPVVTSTMVANGHDVKKTIGTVNTAEFLVTVAETTTFALLIQDMMQYTQMIAGMIVGGVIAAPIAARLCTKLPAKPLMVAVGILLVLLNGYQLLKTIGM